MSESIRLQESLAAAGVKDVDESIWQAWKTRAALRERQQAAARTTAVKYVSLGILLTTTVYGGYAGWYQVAIRFALVAGALTVAAQAFRSERHGFAAVFGAICLIYNPILPVFPLNGEWPLWMVLLTVAAFTASLIWLGDPPEKDRLNHSPEKDRTWAKAGVSAWENEGGAAVPPEQDFTGETLQGARK